ncbi:electron transport complex subunit RsxC [Pokkaliibacter plantistimulans]
MGLNSTAPAQQVTTALRIWDFNGGVHPPENKTQSTTLPIAQPPLPSRLILPLKQHAGAAAEPIVQVGDKVLKGQMLAEPFGRVSAAVHAPTSGTIVAISPFAVPHPSGMQDLCIHLQPDGQDTWGERQRLADYRHESRETVLSYLRNAGVAGLGGAGFPTDVKLNTPDHHPIDTLILNGAECEPYITADDMLMRERADEVIRGGEILAWLLGNPKIVIGIEDNKPEAIAAMREAASRCLVPVEIGVVPTKYPSGGAKQLTYLLTGKEVPSSGRSSEIGVVCCNVGTAAAAFRAVYLGEPLISRVTTLTGQALQQPRNVDALIGTPVDELLAFAGLQSQQLGKLVMGGPMMGFPLNDLSIPVTKLTNCLIASTPAEFPPAPPAQACIRCGLCEQACPADLLPQQLYWFAKAKEYEKAQQFNLFDCIECGACAYVCPSFIPLVQYYRHAKDDIRKESQEQQKAEHARLRFEARQARLQRELDEKEAKRKARAEEAAKAQSARQQPAAVTAPAATPAAAESDIKALKTAAAIARTKVKKAEKALSAAQQAGEHTAELEQELSQLTAASQAAEQALAQAEQSAAAVAPVQAAADIKQLKIDAAITRTKAKKAEKALAAARESGEGDVAQLEAEFNQLNAIAQQAEHALQQAEHTPVAAAPVQPAADIKQLKIDAAITRTKAKKAEKALAAARESGEGDIAQLEAEFNQLNAIAQQAERALQQAEQAPVAATPAQPAADVKQLKIDAAITRTKAKKAEKALAAARESGEGDIAQLEAEFNQLNHIAQQAEKALQQAESGATATEAATVAVKDLKTLKTEAAVARTKLKKAEQALKNAEEKGLDGCEPLRDTVKQLQQKADEAQQALEQAENGSTTVDAPVPAAPAADIKQLKINAAMANAALKKAERALSQAEADGTDISAQQAAVEQAKAQAEQASQALTAAQG